MATRTALVGAVVVAGFAVVGPHSSPAPTKPSLRTVASVSSPQSATFGCVGFPQTFLVPEDVTSLTAVAIGGGGGGSDPGAGADITAHISGLVPGQRLGLTVACPIHTSQANTDIRNDNQGTRPRQPGGYGYTNGGNGGSLTPSGSAQRASGGAGGGSTAITSGGAPLLVAGGGGGTGGRGNVNPPLTNGVGGTGGDAQPLTGNPGGTGGSTLGDAAGAGGQPQQGASGTGVDGQDVTTPQATATGAGGGGGGGYKGGGGGFGAPSVTSGGGGGAGGSSYLGPGVSVASGSAMVAPSAATASSITLSWNSSEGNLAPLVATCTQQRTTYVVPADVDQLQVTSIGGPGGAISQAQSLAVDTNNYNAHGGGATAVVDVKPGDVIDYGVGCAGSADTRGRNSGFQGQGPNPDGGFGWAYGGAGGSGSSSGAAYGLSGCGGGGSTAAADGLELLAEAGGGGGCGGVGELSGSNDVTHGGDAPNGGAGGVSGANAGGGGSPGSPGTSPSGANSAVATGGGGGGGGGGSSLGNGGGAGAGGIGFGDGGGGGGALSGAQGVNAGAGNFDPNPWFNTGSLSGLLVIAPYHLDPPIDLSVAASWQTAKEIIDSTDTLSVTVTNNAPTNEADATASNVMTTVSLPSGDPVTSSKAPAGTTYNASTGVWSVPSLAAGASVTLTVTVRDKTYGTQVANASVAGDQYDPVSANNVARATFSTYDADVAIGLRASAPTAVQGQLETLTLTASNVGDLGAQNVVVFDTLPAGLTLVSVGTPTQGTASSGNGTVEWLVGTLSIGSSQTLTVQATYTASTAVTDAATVSSGTADGNPGNDRAQVTISPSTAPADLAVTVATDYAGTERIGNDLSYLVTVTNEGPNTASGIDIDSTLTDDEEQIRSLAQYEGDGSGGVQTADTTNDYPGGPVLHWRPPVIASGDSYTLVIRFTLQPASQTPAGDNFYYPVATIDSVRAASTPTDPNAANDEAKTGYNLVHTADLALVAYNHTPQPAPGATDTVIVAAEDNGPYDATGAAATFTIPSGLTLVSATPSQGTFDAASGVWTIGTDTVAATSNSQAPSITFVLRPTGMSSYQVQGHVTESAPGDDQPANDTVYFSVAQGAAEPAAALPEAPYAPLLLLAAAPPVALFLRRRRRLE